MTHVYVALERDGRGLAPFEAEELDAVPVEQDRYRIRGIPFWVHGLDRGDVVRVVRNREDEQLWVTEVLEDGGHWTSRVLPADAGAVEAVAARFAALGCEAWPGFGLVAVDVPPAADSERILRELEAGQRDGTWDFDIS